jgi:hypothetical protein
MTPRTRGIIVVAVLVLMVTSFIFLKVSAWKDFDGTVKGTKVEGDKSVSPTTFLNRIYYAHLGGWKAITVFEVSEEAAENGYDIGYRAFDGETKVQGKVNHERRFRMKNGYEDCIFFAIDHEGKEIPLTIVARATTDDATYFDAPPH